MIAAVGREISREAGQGMRIRFEDWALVVALPYFKFGRYRGGDPQFYRLLFLLIRLRCLRKPFSGHPRKQARFPTRTLIESRHKYCDAVPYTVLR